MQFPTESQVSALADHSPEHQIAGGDRYAAIATPVLGWIVALAGLSTVVITVLMVVSSYSPVLFWDHWDVIRELLRHHTHITISELWAQHNEHRIPISKLLFYADLFWFHGRSKSLLIEIITTQLLIFVLFVWTLSRFQVCERKALLTASGVLAYCLFSPLQINNFVWPFQVTFLLAALGSFLSFAAALQYSRIPETNNHIRLWLLVLCVAGALFAEGNLASGLLTWPLLSLLAFLVGFPRRHQAVIAGIGLAAIGTYFLHYKAPPAPPANINPFGLLKFTLTELGWSLDPNLPNVAGWPTLSESLTFLSVGAGLLVTGRILFAGARRTPFASFLAVSFLYSLVAVGLTAIGRLRYGLSQATESRYQSLALLFWAMFFLLGITDSWKNTRRLICLQLAALVLFLCGYSRFGHMYAWAKSRQDGLAQGWEALISSSTKTAAPDALYYDRPMLRSLAAYLIQHNWGPSFTSSERSQTLLVVPDDRSGAIASYHTQGSNQCRGFIDNVQRSPTDNELVVSGWAWSNPSHSVPSDIVLTDKRGSIVGHSQLGLPRPDVQQAVSEVTSPDTGWRIAIRGALIPGVYHVFALEARSKTACPVTNELVVGQLEQRSR